MAQSEYGNDIISVTGEDGKDYLFEEIDRIETDDEKRYVALLQIDNEPEDALTEDDEVIILRVIEDESGETFLTEIESEGEFLEIREIFEERFSKMFEYEDEDGED